MRTVKRRAGVGIQHLDHRDYVPGDEVRHIDWRQTARRQRPIVRQFESETVSDWVVMLDLSSSMSVHGAAKWQAAASGAAAMCYALLELGHRVGLIAFGRGVRAECRRGRGRAHYAAVVRTLGRLGPELAGEPSDLGACARRLHGDASVIVFSDFLGDEEMRRDLARCSSAAHPCMRCRSGTLPRRGSMPPVTWTSWTSRPERGSGRTPVRAPPRRRRPSVRP